MYDLIVKHDLLMPTDRKSMLFMFIKKSIISSNPIIYHCLLKKCRKLVSSYSDLKVVTHQAQGVRLDVMKKQ